MLVQAAKEVSTALALNYPSSADMAAVCGYERPLDRWGFKYWLFFEGDTP